MYLVSASSAVRAGAPVQRARAIPAFHGCLRRLFLRLVSAGNAWLTLINSFDTMMSTPIDTNVSTEKEKIMEDFFTAMAAAKEIGVSRAYFYREIVDTYAPIPKTYGKTKLYPAKEVMRVKRQFQKDRNAR